MSTLSLDKSVGQLVAEQPARSRVFERWGLDYCCGGKRPLGEACAKKNLDPGVVLFDLEACDKNAPEVSTDWTKAPLRELCDHIQSVHHDYLREALPRLSFLTGKVAERHGERDPRLVELHQVFESFRAEMEEHMGKEEAVLFPALRNLDKAAVAPEFPCGTIDHPIRQMMAEHDDAGADLERMRLLTNGFTPEPTDCNTHRAMLQALAELESDTHQHVHKENNILFPRAMELAAGK